MHRMKPTLYAYVVIVIPLMHRIRLNQHSILLLYELLYDIINPLNSSEMLFLGSYEMGLTELRFKCSIIYEWSKLKWQRIQCYLVLNFYTRWTCCILKTLLIKSVVRLTINLPAYKLFNVLNIRSFMLAKWTWRCKNRKY